MSKQCPAPISRLEKLRPRGVQELAHGHPRSLMADCRRLHGPPRTDPDGQASRSPTEPGCLRPEAESPPVLGGAGPSVSAGRFGGSWRPPSSRGVRDEVAQPLSSQEAIGLAGGGHLPRHLPSPPQPSLVKLGTFQDWDHVEKAKSGLWGRS